MIYKSEKDYFWNPYLYVPILIPPIAVSAPPIVKASNSKFCSPHKALFQKECSQSASRVYFISCQALVEFQVRITLFWWKTGKPQACEGFKINLIFHNSMNVPFIFLSVQIIKHDIEPKIKASVGCFSSLCCFPLIVGTDVFHLIWVAPFLH